MVVIVAESASLTSEESSSRADDALTMLNNNKENKADKHRCNLVLFSFSPSRYFFATNADICVITSINTDTCYGLQFGSGQKDAT